MTIFILQNKEIIMKTISISSFSNEAASKTKGELLKREIEPSIASHEEVTVDFSGITRFASPFFNNSFASLVIQYGIDILNCIHLSEISNTGRETYETSIENARLLRSKPEFTDEINKIIENPPKKVD